MTDNVTGSSRSATSISYGEMTFPDGAKSPPENYRSRTNSSRVSRQNSQALEEKPPKECKPIGASLIRQFSEISNAQPSKALSAAGQRGRTPLEQKAAWPFDYYQASGYYPVDYRYWYTPYQTSIGVTQLTMMHAVAYARDGSPFSADQMDHRQSMRKAHVKAMDVFYQHVSNGSS